MNVIYKYELSPRTTISLSPGAKILTVQMQGRVLAMWAKIDLEYDVADYIPRHFICVNTGDPFDDIVKSYIGTVTSGYGIVWHVFEVEK